ncbi:unnamed protein product [Chondrus crispus]|uniref:Uncharacterized protein n=1 Tax=Chondrus crispus TaxID=2769 RepID=R7QN24_CHOCR|nr:unnamed protein product [Chondrus crispus]CDF39907.1 unnamed protein product [Chondrus crispus]|eukprot:XP_005710201.1 unnamed protein product [Chondrus crispus]
MYGPSLPAENKSSAHIIVSRNATHRAQLVEGSARAPPGIPPHHLCISALERFPRRHGRAPPHPRGQARRRAIPPTPREARATAPRSHGRLALQLRQDDRRR